MKIICISDLHGKLPNNIPECDLLIIAGDICPNLWPRNIYNSEFERRQVQQYYQMGWLIDKFETWMFDLIGHGGVQHIVMVPGNHDFIFENYSLVEWFNGQYNSTNIKLLINNCYTIYDVDSKPIKIYGSPLCNKINGSWAFEASEETMERVLRDVPNDVDILISHGPAYKVLDCIPGREASDDCKWPEDEHVGSKALADCILRVSPKLVVCGHIHSSYGITKLNNTTIINASLLNDSYEMINKPIEFIL